MSDKQELPPLTAEAFDAMLERSALFQAVRQALSGDRVAVSLVSPPLDASFLNRFPSLSAL